MALGAFALVLLLIAVGKLCTELRLLPPSAATTLNQIALNVCLPAAVLRFASQLEFDSGLLGLMLVPWLLLLFSVVVLYLLAKVLAFAESERAVLLLCVPLGNTSFLGYPLIEAFLGSEALPYAVAYDQFGSFLILSTWGSWVLARYGGDRPPTFRMVAGKVLRFPPFIALLIAVTLMPVQPTGILADVLERLSDALLPIVALAVGLQLKLRVQSEDRSPLAVGLALKLVVLPTLAWSLCLALGMPDRMLQASVLESAMAPMITASALAISHRLAPSLAAAMVGFGTPLSLLSLLGWKWVLGLS
ncbi:MAG: AEC family transporter [Pseudomarimonas sp.]